MSRVLTISLIASSLALCSSLSSPAIGEQTALTYMCPAASPAETAMSTPLSLSFRYNVTLPVSTYFITPALPVSVNKPDDFQYLPPNTAQALPQELPQKLKLTYSLGVDPGCIIYAPVNTYDRGIVVGEQVLKTHAPTPWKIILVNQTIGQAHYPSTKEPPLINH